MENLDVSSPIVTLYPFIKAVGFKGIVSYKTRDGFEGVEELCLGDGKKDVESKKSLKAVDDDLYRNPIAGPSGVKKMTVPTVVKSRKKVNGSDIKKPEKKVIEKKKIASSRKNSNPHQKFWCNNWFKSWSSERCTQE